MVSLENISIPVQLIGGLYRIPVCTKRVWDMLKGCISDGDLKRVCGMLLEGVPLPLYECRVLVQTYILSMEKLRVEVGLTLPYYKTEKSPDDVKYTVYTELDKLAADYAGDKSVCDRRHTCYGILAYSAGRFYSQALTDGKGAGVS